MSRLLALIGFCVALGASTVPAGAFQRHEGPVFESHGGALRGGDRGHRDRGVIVIDRHGDGWRGDRWRFGEGRVVVIDPRFGGRFGDGRRSDRDHRHGDHAQGRRHGGFRGHAPWPQQRHRRWD